jgi:hypothetical protein
VNGNTATVVTLKNALQSAHRALTNAGNSSDFTAIKGQVDTVSGSIAELMNTVSSQPQFEIYWNNASHNADDQMQGVPVALKAQEQMEKLVGALDEDMAALVPGFQLSRIVQFAETLGSARTAVEAVGESLKSSERDATKVGDLKKQLADSMSRVEAISKEPELTKLAAGTDTVVTSMSALYTGLAQGLAVETLTALQGKASAALNDLKVVEGEVKKELEHRHYSGSTFVYFPHMYHWHSTGMISPYSSWGGASGFASTSRFSSGASASAGDATHAGLAKGASATAAKSFGGFKGSGFAKPGASSGFKSGGFGKTGTSFSGRAVS